MPRLIGRALAGFLLAASAVSAQTALIWEQVRERFRTNNPNLTAGRVGVEQSKAQEITAYLRPNPDVTATLDQLDPFSPNPYRPLGNALPLVPAAICTSASTSVNCGGIARRVRRPSLRPLSKIRNARCCLLCAARLFLFCTPKKS